MMLIERISLCMGKQVCRAVKEISKQSMVASHLGKCFLNVIEIVFFAQSLPGQMI